MDQSQETNEQQKIIKNQKSSNAGGHSEELVDHYWGSINYVSSLIRASEIKAGLILSFYGILFNIIYQNLGFVIELGTIHFFLYVLLGLYFIFTTASIFYSIRCFMPHIEGKYEKNMFFFGDVISKFGNIKEFSKTFYKISLSEADLFDQLGQQIFINSKIAAIKFKNVNRSIFLLAIGLLLLFVITFSCIVISI